MLGESPSAPIGRFHVMLSVKGPVLRSIPLVEENELERRSRQCRMVCHVLGCHFRSLGLFGHGPDIACRVYILLANLPPICDSPVSRASVIGLYTSYAAPIFLRITSGRNKLEPGPFSLGRWSTPIGAISVSWVTFIVIMLLFPPEQDATADTMSKYFSS